MTTLSDEMKRVGQEVNRLVREIDTLENAVRTVWDDKLCKEIPRYTKAQTSRLTKLRRELATVRAAQDALCNTGLK